MYAPGALWTAARHKIPLLAVMHNNRGYHQEVMHVQRLANFRNRSPNKGDDLGPIGTSIMNPDIEYHKLAEAMGWWAKGPIRDPAALGPTIKGSGRGREVWTAGAAERLDTTAIGRERSMSSIRLQIVLAAAFAAGLLINPNVGIAASVDNGKKAFVQRGCWECHGFEGQGSTATSGGKVIADTKLPLDAFTSFVRNTH